MNVQLNKTETYEGLDGHPDDDGVSGFVTIQRGCDKFCTFCVVPYTRGVEESRPTAEIRDEVERLCADGVKEITLLGQTIDSWGKRLPGRPNLGHLLEADSTLEDRTQRYWRELDRQHYGFDLRENLAAAIRRVTLAELKASYDAMLRSADRKRLVVRAQGLRHDVAAGRHRLEHRRARRQPRGEHLRPGATVQSGRQRLDRLEGRRA